MHTVTIERAGPEDVREIMTLQRLAFQSEARLVNDFSIPPMVETEEEIEAQRRGGILLKALDTRGVIVGSIRGRTADGTAFFNRLMVHPDWQGKGLGARLLNEIERQYPQSRFEIFTSDKSVSNLSWYDRKGYVRFKEYQADPEWRIVYLEKFSQPGIAGR